MTPACSFFSTDLLAAGVRNFLAKVKPGPQIEPSVNVTAGLTIVPVVPWEGPPPPRAPDQLPFLPRCLMSER